LTGLLNASSADVIQFPAPVDCTLLYATCSAQAKGGTQGTSTVTVKNAGVAMTNAMDLGAPAAKSQVEATVVDAQRLIAKDATVSVDLVMTGGTAPTLTNVSIFMVFARRG
jgi:hypothetical protein